MVLYVIACYGTVLHRNIFIAWYTMLSYGIERFQAVSIYATMYVATRCVERESVMLLWLACLYYVVVEDWYDLEKWSRLVDQ